MGREVKGSRIFATYSPGARLPVVLCRKRNSSLSQRQFRDVLISAKLCQSQGCSHRLTSKGCPMASYRLRINGVERTIEPSDPDQPLLYGLRGLVLTATKVGCGLGQCE